MKFELNQEQVRELHSVLDVVLADLSYEIAGTDNPNYRSELRQRRELLSSVRGALEATNNV